MAEETITINKQDWERMYKIQLKMEQYFSYKNDNRKVMAEMATLFLDDVEKTLEENNN
jgi:hypothetical protein